MAAEFLPRRKPAEQTLEGTSETVAGAPYTLMFHVPSGTQFASVNATVGGTRVAARTSLTGELLSVTFDGQSAPVRWSVAFAVL